ncbi:hypothetical protein ACFYVL_32980 [Streptomyces sp. NPDC004111]|uniref:hypothetical protein n=1 Tax=Streptomyces sp. NPDC004111 TaxID=3364690 RepID=UPI003674D04A
MVITSRKRFAVAVAALALGGGLALPVTTATAVTTAAPAAQNIAVRGTAPACVARDVIKQKKQVTVTNNCNQVMHVKLVINNGPDGQCWTYQRGDARLWTWKLGSYGKIVTC